MKLRLSIAIILGISHGVQNVESFCTSGKTKNRRPNMKAFLNMPPLSSDADAANGDSPFSKDIDNIFAQNAAWKEAQEKKDPEFFEKLGAVTKPSYMWIGCADARVPANEIIGLIAGSVFVARNFGNLVVATDFNLMSALQYAVTYLNVNHIIVCGHYDCSGVRLAETRNDHIAPLESWLRNIRDVYRLHQKELDKIKDPEKRHRRLVELNVIEQCINVYKTGVVQRKRVETYQAGQEFTTPRIHGLVFDPRVGRLKRLNVDFAKYTKNLNEIYDLYDAEADLTDKIYA